MTEQLLRSRTLSRLPLEDRQQEVSKHVCLMLLEPVLLHKKSLQGKMPQLLNVLENVLACSFVSSEELGEEGAAYSVVFGHWPNQFDHLREMVVSLAVVLAFARVKEEVTRDQLECHAGHRPKVSTHIVIESEHHFRTTILPRLNLLSEVVVRPASVSQVTDLKRDLLVSEWSSLVHILGLHLSFLLLFSLLLGT